jgi:hypothetical protein
MKLPVTLMSHVLPVKPGAQIHMYPPFNISIQALTLPQGFGLHGDIFVSQFTPV